MSLGIDITPFSELQGQFDEESNFRESIRDVVKQLDRLNRTTSAHLSKLHSLTSADFITYLDSLPSPLFSSYPALTSQIAGALVGRSLWKYDQIWSREMQNATMLVLIERWAREDGKLAKREEVQKILGIEGEDEGRPATPEVEADIKPQIEEKLRITDEEYLHACCGLIDELSRLCVNTVIVGEFDRATKVAGFVKELADAFRVLNLKNDSLRKRVDGLKYAVKKVEDVVYDLRLRNLVGGKKEDGAV